MSSRPVVAHVLNSIGLGGVPEVAWQLLRRLPDDHFALANALVQVLDDGAMAAAMGAAGRERALTFSWDRSAERLEAVYAAALAGRA